MAQTLSQYRPRNWAITPEPPGGLLACELLPLAVKLFFRAGQFVDVDATA